MGMAVGLASVQAADTPIASDFPVLKFRAEVVTEPVAAQPDQVHVALGVNTNLPDRLVPGEETLINRQDWASAVDMLKKMLAESEVLRLVEPPIFMTESANTNAPTATEASMSIHAKFARRAADSVVHLRLASQPGGLLLVAANASEASMSKATEKALRQIERELLKMPWHCRVAENHEGKAVIYRGRLDGLRKGQKLLGYTLSAEGQKDRTRPDELLIKLHSSARGNYQVAEVGEFFSLVTPLENSGPLAAGDILEVPALKLRDTQRSPARTKWDAIYDR